MVRRHKQEAITSRKQFDSLSASKRLSSHRALHAVSLMRRGNLSLEKAATQAGTTPETVRRYAADALTQSGSGRYSPKEADRLYRRMTALTSEGLVEVDVRGSRMASHTAEYMNAVRHFLQTGDTTVLSKFKGMQIGGRELLTDPQTIEELAFRHELEFEDIYQTVD